VKSSQREELNRVKARLSDLYKELRHDLGKLLSDHGHKITMEAVRMQDTIARVETALDILREV